MSLSYWDNTLLEQHLALWPWLASVWQATCPQELTDPPAPTLQNYVITDLEKRAQHFYCDTYNLLH